MTHARDEPVMICEVCGRGFLVSPGKLDPVPIWFTLTSQSEGACLGRIKMVDRQTQIRNLDNREKSNGQDH